ncbi:MULTISPECIES: acyl-CoA dehydrogenase family protein [Rhodopseudomonas]|uniref:Acyl-CoA dehydrogenase n=1 Tax=Rhodopseudomonas palustris TaxID=1076 RepID=A0A0D7F5S3_RHOPL|nr:MULTISPECIES: acyl-CoA dehydrogenase family protein [Rhodopseudomonas]KIZ48131.1 acyl-CoA dehydrogenase [Rhodopseudomonas palustris]MDF3810826.1 acyl-CoA/acyl-ACP dehydrogenase [Rhodopseudomonas sp. BAL398]WOK17278.1 acyl-CoA dehydrogenase family protein [Rhodopseudomonas sp. BAL398]
MLDVQTIRQSDTAAIADAGVIEAVRSLSARELPALVNKIDVEGYYPEQVMRDFGRLGAYAQHLPGHSTSVDLVTAINAMAAAGEHCLSTSFCMWCQDALAWYVYCSDNEALKTGIGPQIASGAVLGGTALSNPMKSLFGIEPMRLKGRRANGGYVVKGLLPYVSNLGAGHYFGGIFEVADGSDSRNVMAVIPCDAEGVTLADNAKFTALDGTRTFAVQMRDVAVPDAWIIADPVDDYIKRIRAGFILLQAGMAFGLIRDCIRLMEQTRGPLGHVNKYLDVQPEPLAEQLVAMEAEVARLAATPFETDLAYWRAVIEARLAAGDASVAAAHGAMLHCGARGYVANAAAQRRLREAYFVAIVTPATKQLRKMLADMGH